MFILASKSHSRQSTARDKDSVGRSGFSSALLLTTLAFGTLVATAACEAALPTQGPTSSSAAAQSPHDRPPGPVIRVSGNQLVDAVGKPVQLRGVNFAGFGLAPIQAWAWTGNNPRVYDNWGMQRPEWPALASWKINVVRIPLNEASWLGLDTYDPVPNDSGGADGHQHAMSGSVRHADPGGNYRSEVREAVETATRMGLYVILDLHSSGPDISIRCAQAAVASGNGDTVCPPATNTPRVPMTPFIPNYTQNPLPDADHSVTFWSSVAGVYKAFPNVIFDLYNEPFIEPWFSPPEGQWVAWLRGTDVPYYHTGGNPPTIHEAWRSAGMQSLVDAVRATGSTNVVICGGLGYAGDMRGWIDHVPHDPLAQLGASWHAYSGSNVVGSPKSKEPAWGTRQYGAVLDIAKAYPVIIGETGDHNTAGTVGAPFVSILLPWADAHGVSYLGWSWNTWGNSDNTLLKNFDGTPTDGYGRYFRDHLRCVAALAGSTSPCP